MSVERSEEAPEMTAEIDEEQSAGEPTKEIAEIEQLKIIEQDEDGTWVRNWVIEVLAWIKRMEMVESKLSTFSWAFKELCWPKLHGNVKPHTIQLYFDGERDQSGNLRSVVRSDYYRGPELPIPQVPPPEYIPGFYFLTILFLDDRTTEFIRLIASEINDIELRIYADIARDEWIKTIECLLSIFGNKITKLYFITQYKIKKFNILFPGILNQIKKLNMLLFDGWTRDKDSDVLFDWLMNGQQDGQKTLEIDIQNDEYEGFVERIKEAFLINDTVRRNFIVRFMFEEQVNNEFFEEKTGEILHFYRKPEFDDGGRFCHFLIRCPKEEEGLWKKEGEKKYTDWGYGTTDTTDIEVGDDRFWR